MTKRKAAIIITLACSFVLGAAALLARAQAQDPNKEELKLKLPKPMFIGTPRNIKTPNLEAVTGKPRGPFFVAKGTKLLSLKKPVTSSDMQPVIGELAFVTDGEKSGEDGYFVELGPGKQWVQIDLGAENASPPSWSGIITARPASTATSSSRSPTTRTSSRASRPSSTTTTTTRPAWASAGTRSTSRPTKAGSSTPRAPRAATSGCISNGNTSNDMNHYVEVEVYGMPAK